MAFTFLSNRKSSPAQFTDNGSDHARLATGSVALRTSILDEFERAGGVWVWATDAEGKLLYLTEKARQLLAVEEAAVIGKTLGEVFEHDPNNSDAATGRSLRFLIKSHSTIRDQIVRFALNRPASDPRQTWWSISGQPVRDAAGEFIGYRGSAKDVTAEYERHLADTRLAEYDSLTGLANRHAIKRYLDSAISAYTASHRPCALMMLDLDKFKHVNDTLGHQAGDQLLVQVADRLSSVVGQQGKVARLGGDEFQVVVPGEDDRGKLGELAEKIIKILSQPYSLDEGKRAVIGASVGIAVFPFDGSNFDEINRSADLALYASKNGGRGQFRFYSSDLKNEEEVRQQLLDELREALAKGQLAMHYQPVVSIDTGAVVCLEALMRWEHPEKGWISPKVFIPVAEETDLINPLGEWALRQACAAAVKWPETVKVAVNVSANQFVNPGFPEVVSNALAATGLAPDRLELELTESVFLGDSEATERIFAMLKGLGVRLALDDFGTGYSSLSYLRSAPFDKIKVDRSFVDSCTQKDRNSAKIIAAIVGLANALGMETTVEGVEALDQLAVVREKGAKLVQGFLYAQPMPEADVVAAFENGDYRIEPRGPEKFRPDRRSVFRRIGVIHDDYYYNVVMRDLSRTGAGIQGIVGVPVGTALVLDLGEGQLMVCEVIRSHDDEIGVEFETPLVSDGAGGLCTRHRLSPYMIAAAGLPKRPGAAGPTEGKRNESRPKFLEVTPGSFNG